MQLRWQVIIKIKWFFALQQTMARNNVFKLSGNMALGSSDPYGNDFDNIKSSLKLLKSKQPQKQQNSQQQPPNSYGGSYSSNVPSRQQQGYNQLSSNQYQNAYNYPPQGNVRGSNQGGSYKDVYYQMEQHYPKNDYKTKRNNEEYEPNYQDYQKPAQRQQPQRQPPQRQQAPQPRQQQKQQQQKQQQQPPQDYRQQRGGNSFEERNIKEINRQNRIEIKEYDPSELIECGEGCGRKFNPDSISKHEAVCRKVFQKKRKEFNAQDQRIVANEQKKLIKRGEIIDKKLQQKKAREKIPKWKAESLQLRAGLKQARNEDYQPTRQEKQIMQAANQMVKCYICGRSFNEEAAKKHIPFCEAQQKKNQMKRR